MTYEDMIEIDAVKERFMGNYKMFSMYLFQFAQGELFGSLKRTMETGDMEAAFDVAHDMKGVVLNLSLRMLENPIVSVVESFRNGQMPDEKQWKAFADAYESTVEWIEKLKQEGTELF